MEFKHHSEETLGNWCFLSSTVASVVGNRHEVDFFIIIFI